MNQQRQRRFRSAETMAEESKNEPGGKAPFDSNCITPGTPFMARLSEVIKFYIQKKVKEDQSWRDVEIIFSGHEVPGEGEHKILEYIRHQKSTSTYNPNLSHCMYGLDADLIMLALVSHEPHFSLIREDDVLKNNRTKSPVASFHFLHISLVREYISMDFESLKQSLPKSCPWDLERLIDDFILLCFLVGNDFLPTLPTLNIAEGSLNFIIDTYRKVLPMIGDYITKRGEINLAHLEAFFRTFCQGEENNFDVLPQGHHKLDRKRRKKGGKKAKTSLGADASPATQNAFRALEKSTNADLASVLFAQRQADSDDSEEEDSMDESDEESSGEAAAAARNPRVSALNASLHSDLSSPTGYSTERSSPSVDSSASEYNPLDHPSTLSKGLGGLKLDDSAGLGLFGAGDGDEENEKELWKITYYRQKLDMDLTDTEKHDRLRTCYLEGLIWVYHYYMHGCISWSWYFPYHYAPLISDLVNITQYESRIKFERGSPFKPYQQLLGVLPPKSAPLLPQAYQHLLLSPTSPLAPYIPEKLEIDRDGTKNEWEGVTLLPFMDQKVIIEASESIPLSALSAEEIRCNTFGHSYTYKYDPNITATVPSPQKELFDDLLHCGSEALVYRHPDPSSPAMLSHMENQPPLLNSFYLLPGTHLGANKPPTLPTLFSKKLISNLQKNNTRVLQRPANFSSLVVRICDFDDENETAKNRGKNIKYTRRDKRADPVSLEMDMIATQYLDTLVYVWPYNREAKVVSVIDENGYYDASGELMKGKEADMKLFKERVKELDDFAEQQQAVDIGDVRCIFEVLYLHGVSRSADGSLKKQWSEKSTFVPFQCILEEVPFGPDPRFLERPAPPLEEQFPIYSSALYIPPTGGAMYGVMGTVMEHKEDDTTLTLTIDQIERLGPLAGNSFIGNDFEKWYSARDLAKMAGIAVPFVGRITSSIILDDRSDLGLQLRFQGRGQQTLGYTRRIETVDRHTGQMNSWWEYSQKACDLVVAYVEAFPDIFEILVKLPLNNVDAFTLFKESEQKERAAEKAAKSESPQPQEGDDELAGDALSSTSSDSEDEAGEKKQKKGRPGRRGVGPQFIRQKQMAEWLSHHRPSKSLRVAVGTVGLDRVVIKKLEGQLDAWAAKHPEPVNPMTRPFTIPRTQAYSPLPPLEVLHKNNIDAVGRANFRLGERAVFVLNSGAVPFGSMGTIVTVSKTHVELLLDTPSVGGTDLSGRCSHRRGVSVPHGSVVNISAPVRKTETSLRQSGSSSSPAWAGNSSDRIRSSAGGSDQIRRSRDESSPHHPSGQKGARGGHQGSGSSRNNSPASQQGQHQGQHGGKNHNSGQQTAATPSAKKVATRSPKDNAPPKQTASTAATGGAKKVAGEPKEKKPKASAAALKEAAAGKPVAVGDLFNAGGAAPAASSEPLNLAGVSLDAQQLSFFNALSAGHGTTFAQQNMPSVAQPQFGMMPPPYGQPPMMMPGMMPMQPYPGAYMPAPGPVPVVSQPPQPSQPQNVDALFQGAKSTGAKATSSSRNISLDSLLPGQAAPSQQPPAKQ